MFSAMAGVSEVSAVLLTINGVQDTLEFDTLTIFKPDDYTLVYPNRAYAYDGRWKLILNNDGDQLYDLKNDPGETVNRWDDKPNRRNRLLELLGL